MSVHQNTFRIALAAIAGLWAFVSDLSAGEGVPTDAVSRELSVFVPSQDSSADDAVSRAYSVYAVDPSAEAVVGAVSRELSVYATSPDLIVLPFSGPAELEVGASFSLSWTVHNDGDDSAFGPWTDRLYLSTDQQLDGNDLEVISSVYSGPPLAAGETANFNEQVDFLDLPAGEYWVIAQTDSSDVLEEGEFDSNNITVSDVPTMVTYGNPNLVELTVPTAIACDDMSLEGMDVVANGTTLTIDCTHRLQSLLLVDGAIVTHTAGGSPPDPCLLEGGQRGMRLIISGDLAISPSSAIDVVARGHAAQSGPGKAFGCVGGVDGSGAGYGGNGGQGAASPGVPGGTYGDPLTPNMLGSGGCPVNTARGGGTIHLIVSGTTIVLGTITADGQDHIGTGAGGGSGGSILIEANVLSGGGSIRANGGAGSSAGVGTGGSGGGGRVAVTADMSAFAGGITACGNDAANDSGAGTVFVHDLSNEEKTLRIDNCGITGGITEFASPFVFDGDMLVLGGARVLPHPKYGAGKHHWALTGDLSIDATSGIEANGRGHPYGAGPGKGAPSGGTCGSGGGYGGPGGAGSCSGAIGGAAYGSPDEPFDWGSGGGVGLGGSGGSGGGAVHLNVVGTLTVDGEIASDGQNAGGANASGGGSGGSIWIECDALSGSGSIHADGGAGSFTGGSGGGGGGRIAVYTPDETAFTGTIQANGGGGGFSGGDVGTIVTDIASPNGPPVGDPLNLLDLAFDTLSLGTMPDCESAAAGAWGFPQPFVFDSHCESESSQVSVVETNTFDSLATGNSLQLQATELDLNDIFLAFPLPAFLYLNENFDEVVRVEFRIWVEPSVNGGTVIVGGDEGAGGVGVSERGPQLSWLEDGTIVWWDTTPNSHVVLADYPRQAWQAVRLDINLETDTFDMSWGPDPESLQTIGTDLTFRGGSLDHIDHLILLRAISIPGDAHSYFDDFSVAVRPVSFSDCNANNEPDSCDLPGDLTGDGVLAADDIPVLVDNLLGLSTCVLADVNSDGIIDGRDIAGFVTTLFGG